jgi:restriction system protein
MPRPKLRIPLFDDHVTFYRDEVPRITHDNPIPAFLSPDWRSRGETGARGSTIGEGLNHEATRLLRFKTCPYCRVKMKRVLMNEQPSGEVYLCLQCNYWGAEGQREFGHGQAVRTLLGRYSFVSNPLAVPLEILLTHLRKHPSELHALAPRQAEALLAGILMDALDCEVRLVGGVKDHGIDALLIRGNDVRTIVQIKWRESSRRAESVAVVREVAGTLLARGIPRGMLISTRASFSKAAQQEAELVSQRSVDGIGKLSLDLKAFDDIVDMLDVRTRPHECAVNPKFIIPRYRDGHCMFDAGGLTGWRWTWDGKFLSTT